ncbi:hypothetical protein BVH03_17595 [Pseudomonas sp. PA15(2017)]|uniref:DUF2857 domain-containing protein n=1 Tax=Pseudomonas sp. PA15(2017) TaxID=1932111 RepID=UPI0009654396|nr:DUF2857 domain-containing protein [Pseudomonas sp. PA15(2017)]OLU25470.1 hypothetical protein BVH03_17595 [Pseudomonas sp. PA15(2017)]
MTDSSLNTAVLYQVMTHLRDGNFRRCLEMGFDQEELVQLNQLSFSDISELTRTPVRFIEITVNHDLLGRALGRLQEEALRQQMIQRAIKLGASLEMLNSLFGITSEEVSGRRRFMGINIKPGRPQMPEVEEMHQLWNRWQKLIAENSAKIDQTDPTAALGVMMILAEETGHPLSIIWKLIREWEADVREMLKKSTKGKPKTPRKKPAAAIVSQPSPSRQEAAR